MDNLGGIHLPSWVQGSFFSNITKHTWNPNGVSKEHRESGLTLCVLLKICTPPFYWEPHGTNQTTERVPPQNLKNKTRPTWLVKICTQNGTLIGKPAVYILVA